MRVVAVLAVLYLGYTAAVWPQPKAMTAGTTNKGLAAGFNITLNPKCATPSLAADVVSRFDSLFANFRSATGTIEQLSLCIQSDDEFLGHTTDESYSLSLSTDASEVTLEAKTVFGAMHGLETFLQLAAAVPAPLSIQDAPRFPYRGLLIDSGRRERPQLRCQPPADFLPIKFVKHIIDGLSAGKLNVLHWHLVDAQSFAVKTDKFPQLAKGAYAPTAVYTSASLPHLMMRRRLSDLADVVSYAKSRGVRIMPEFDVPGHGAWGKVSTMLRQGLTPPWQGMPELMACSDVLDVTKDETYEFLETFLVEIGSVFTDELLFLGGDEVLFCVDVAELCQVDTGCWDRNPDVVAWLKAHNMTSAQLQPYFWEQMGTRVLPKLNRTLSIWENDQLQIDPTAVPKGTVANVYQSLPTADKTVDVGMPTVVSIAGDHWYLDSECGGYNQNAWECIYKVEPLTSNATKTHSDLMWGGEAAMWGEGINQDNFDAFVWRGASAVGERLWSPQPVTDITDAQSRLAAFGCLLSERGIKIGPVGPGFCPSDAW